MHYDMNTLLEFFKATPFFFYVSRRFSQPKAMRECGKKEEEKKTRKKMLHTVHVDQFRALNYKSNGRRLDDAQLCALRKSQCTV